MLTRRELLLASVATAAVLATPARATVVARRFDAAARLRALEEGAARLGVCILDTVTGEITGNRIDEHFAMCSTFKLALVAAYLREADRGRIDLGEVLAYTEADLLPWAPVTRPNLASGGMRIDGLARAAQELSDEELRELHFGVGSRATHRVIYVVDDDAVRVLAVRHAAQEDAEPEELR